MKEGYYWARRTPGLYIPNPVPGVVLVQKNYFGDLEVFMPGMTWVFHVSDFDVMIGPLEPPPMP